MERSPIFWRRVALLWPPPLRNPLEDGCQRTVKIDQQSRRAGRRSMKELSVQPGVQIPLRLRHVALLVQAAGEDLRVLVPGSVQHPAAAEIAHAPHSREPRREKVQLEVQTIGPHPLGFTVEMLEPRIARIDAFESELKAEASGECARERRLSGTDHTGNTEKHVDGLTREVRGAGCRPKREAKTAGSRRRKQPLFWGARQANPYPIVSSSVCGS